MKSRKEKLEGVIAKGKWHFVFWRGMVFWGLSTAISVKVVIYFISGTPFLEDIWVWIFTFTLMGGPLFGLFMWPIINRQYEKLKHKENMPE
ncbi:MAG: hypothetical protein KAR62_07255 [Sphingomonadales bacterium]|nr:hypothetical protein [Sphingomonadales bacterium]